MHTHSLRQLIDGLRQKKFSSVELTQHFLQRIRKYHSLNAFISVADDDYILKQAETADRQLQSAKAHRLMGIPIAHKDNFCTTYLPTTCASKMLENFQSPYQATLVNQLENAGCIMLGKANLDEFAMGSANENSYFGPVNNPWNEAYVPGGSSGGSAACVAARLVPFCTGTDTGGSVRQPAAFCGVSGLKPTYGLISRYGMVAFASSLDQAGLIAKSAEDIAIMLETMAGFDEKDSTSINQPVPSYSSELNTPIDLKSTKIGLPTYFLDPHIDEDIRQSTLDAAKLFEKAGAYIQEVDLSLQPLWIACYYIVGCTEASSNLSRFDGIRFGYRSSSENSIRDLMTHSRGEGFGEEVKRRILTGTHLLSADCDSNDYQHAQKVRRLIQNELLQTFKNVDFMLSPTTPTPPFKQGEKIIHPTHRYLADMCTVAANLGGFPAISIPSGFTSSHLPMGIQLLGPHFSETRMLQLAHYYQQQTNWHTQLPPNYL